MRSWWKRKYTPCQLFMYQAIINTNLVLSNLRRSTKPDILHRVMIEQKLSSSAEAGHEKLSTAVLFPQELRGKVAARCSWSNWSSASNTTSIIVKVLSVHWSEADCLTHNWLLWVMQCQGGTISAVILKSNSCCPSVWEWPQGHFQKK